MHLCALSAARPTPQSQWRLRPMVSVWIEPPLLSLTPRWVAPDWPASWQSSYARCRASSLLSTPQTLDELLKREPRQVDRPM